MKTERVKEIKAIYEKMGLGTLLARKRFLDMANAYSYGEDTWVTPYENTPTEGSGYVDDRVREFQEKDDTYQPG